MKIFQTVQYAGVVLRGPSSNSPSIGSALIDTGSNQLGWTSSPVALSSDLTGYVAKTGDTMTGDLVVNGTVTVASEVYLSTDVRYKRLSAGTALLEVYNATTGWQTGVKIETNTSGVKLGLYGHATALQSSAYTVSNDMATRTLNLSTATLGDVANAIGTLIKDLQSNGSIG